MPRSVFIKAMHPKTEIMPTPAAIEKILKAGWVGQMKIHGHRAQVHLSADSSQEVIVYNRQGKPHKLELSKKIERELRRIFPLESDWTVIDAEWIKPEEKLFLFDVLKLNGKSLRALSYEERYKLLPRLYLSPHVQTLPLYSSAKKCMEVMATEDPNIEGLVFKSPNTRGFSDTAIIRCRKKPLDSRQF